MTEGDGHSLVRRIALTGGIATGKSYVRGRFEQLGVQTIDSDVLARDAVAPGSEGLNKVISRFGQEVLDARGVLDRGYAGESSSGATTRGASTIASSPIPTIVPIETQRFSYQAPPGL